MQSTANGVRWYSCRSSLGVTFDDLILVRGETVESHEVGKEDASYLVSLESTTPGETKWSVGSNASKNVTFAGNSRGAPTGIISDVTNVDGGTHFWTMLPTLCVVVVESVETMCMGTNGDDDDNGDDTEPDSDINIDDEDDEDADADEDDIHVGNVTGLETTCALTGSDLSSSIASDDEEEEKEEEEEEENDDDWDTPTLDNIFSFLALRRMNLKKEFFGLLDTALLVWDCVVVVFIVVDCAPLLFLMHSFGFLFLRIFCCVELSLIC